MPQLRLASRAAPVAVRIQYAYGYVRGVGSSCKSVSPEKNLRKSSQGRGPAQLFQGARGVEHRAAQAAARRLAAMPPADSAGVGPLLESLQANRKDEEKAEALVQLALIVDFSYGDDAAQLCELLRAQHGLARIVELISHPEPLIHQTALLLLGNLSTEAVDPLADKTKALLKELDGFARLIPHIFSDQALTVAYALGAIQNTCTDIDYVSALQQSGAVVRLQDLAQCDQPQIVQYAEACLHNVMETVVSVSRTLQVTKAVVRIQAAARRRLARKELARRASPAGLGPIRSPSPPLNREAATPAGGEASTGGGARSQTPGEAVRAVPLSTRSEAEAADASGTGGQAEARAEAAATKLQALGRRRAVQQRIERELASRERAAVSIQARFRQTQARVVLEVRRAQREAAATRISAAYRGRCARLQVQLVVAPAQREADGEGAAARSHSESAGGAAEAGEEAGVETPAEAEAVADGADAVDVRGSGEEEFESGMRQNVAEFDMADQNQDRKLSFVEFCALVREREVGEHSDEELRARFDALDTNGSGMIDADEYVRFALRDAMQRSATRVVDLFRQWDEDRSGEVDRREFRRAIKALGFDFIATDAEIDLVFDELDKDRSGQVPSA